jgi:hypothetical protein
VPVACVSALACRASSGQDRGSAVVAAGGDRTVSPVTSNAERRQSVQKWALWLAAAIPVAAVIIYLLIWYGPDAIARHDIGNVTGQLRVLRLQQTRDATRGRPLTLGAGLFAAGALLFTGRNYGLALRDLSLLVSRCRRYGEGRGPGRGPAALPKQCIVGIPNTWVPRNSGRLEHRLRVWAGEMAG